MHTPPQVQMTELGLIKPLESQLTSQHEEVTFSGPFLLLCLQPL